MATFIEYELEDGTTVLVQADEPQGGLVPTGRERDVFKKASIKFSEAFSSIKASIATLRQELDELSVDEVEVSFGVKFVGEIGNAAVGKVGTDANYAVTLKWGSETKK
jgi:hypothetical protein